MNEIKVGEWTLTPTAIARLEICHRNGEWSRGRLADEAARCCRIIGIDADADSTAKDIAEEIVLHGTPVAEAIAKLQRHLEAGR